MTGNGGEPQGIEFGFTIILVRNREKRKVQAAATFPTLESARDTLLLVAVRDPRIVEAYITDRKSGQVLWSAAPGVVMAALLQQGLGPGMIDHPVRP